MTEENDSLKTFSSVLALSAKKIIQFNMVYPVQEVMDNAKVLTTPPQRNNKLL